jgi:hypothetical protein
VVFLLSVASDPFFQALHYNEDGQWEDLRFGQETLKLIDSFTQKIDQWRVLTTYEPLLVNFDSHSSPSTFVLHKERLRSHPQPERGEDI